MATKTALYKSPYDPQGIEQMAEYVDNEILIKFREGATGTQINSLLASEGLEKIRDVGLGTSLYSTLTDPIVLVGRLKDNPIVEAVDPNFVQRLQSAPVMQMSPGGNFQGMGIFAVALVLGLILFARK